ncbi:MAG: Ig-like domain-containing protein, partial [Oscillospiraceae bacterium]|nr:Ig-like domain-containing protein [Oscillospiraceae bacterium]
MKRIISLAIILVMMISMLPTVSVGAALEPSGVKVTYNVAVSSVASGATMENVTYTDTNGFWKFEGKHGTATVTRNSGYGVQVAPNLNAWWAIRIYVPASGSYNLKFNHGKVSNGGVASIYFGAADSGASAIAGGTSIGTVCFYGTGTKNNESTAGSVDVSEPGEYIIVLKATGAGDGAGTGTGRRQYFDKIILEGGNALAPMSATLKNAAVELSAGESAAAEVDKIYMSDGSEYSGAMTLGTPVSGNESVAKGEANGKVKGVSEGETTVSIPVMVNGITVKAEMAVKVVGAAVPEGIKAIYSMAVSSVESGATMENITFADTNGFWQFEEKYGTIVVNRDSNNGVQGRPNANAWWALRMYIPKAGTYSVKFNRTLTTNGGFAHLYFGAAEEGATAIAAKQPFGDIYFYGASTTRGISDPVGTVEVEEPGEYIMVLKCPTTAEYTEAGLNSGSRRQYFKEIILEGGEDIAIISAMPEVALAEITQDEKTTIALGKVYMSDGSEYKGTAAVGQALSEDENIARVDANGTVTGINVGETVIKLPVTVDGVTVYAKMKVKVNAASPISVATLEISKASIRAGQSASSSVTAKLENGEAVDMAKATVVYSTEDTDKITVDPSSGKIKGVSAGEATVKVAVTLRGVTVYATNTITVTSPAELSGINIRYDLRGNVPAGFDAFGMTYNDTKGFWCFGESTYVVGAGDSVSRLRTNNLLGIDAQPNGIGKWFAMKLYVPEAGRYELTLAHSAASNGGTGNIYFVSANEAKDKLVCDDTKVGSVCFYAASSKYGTEIAKLDDVTVDAAGEYYIIVEAAAKGNGAGSGTSMRMYPTIVILDGGEGSAMMRVGLSAEREEIYVNGKAATKIDDIYMSDGSAVSLAGAEIIYSSGAADVASVDSEGVITGISDGNAEIYADITLKSGTKIKAGTKVKVTTPPDLESVSAAVEDSEIEEFSTAQITVTGKNVDGSDTQIAMTEVTYESSNPAVASVDSNGVILAKSEGSTVVTVSVLQNGITKACEVAITVVPSKDDENAMPLSNVTAYYDFLGNFTSGTNVFDITMEQTGNWKLESVQNIDEFGSNGTIPRLRVYGTLGIQAQPNKIGSWWALRINVPAAGRYAASLDFSATSAGGIGELYVVPASAPRDTWTAEQYSIGTVDFCQNVTTYNLSKNLKEVEIASAGDYLLVFEAVANGTGGGRQQLPRGFSLDGTGVVSYIEAFLESEAICVGETTRLLYRVKLSDGTWLAGNEDVVFTSSDTSVAKVSSDGIVEGVGEGKADITVTVKKSGKAVSYSASIEVGDESVPVGIELRAPATVYVDGTGTLVQRAMMESGGRIKLDPEGVNYEITGGDGEAEISLGGIITGISEGSVLIRATSTFRGVSIESEIITVNVLAKTQKTEPTLFTYEMRENAKRNIEKYDWAKEEFELYRKNADKYLQYQDSLYSLMIPEGIPRALYVALNAKDPTYSSCKYCGDDFLEAYGSPYFNTDPLTMPWKVQCPTCKRLFPSNDFESFYKLGIDEHGAFNRDLALENHGKMLGRIAEDGTHIDADNPYGYGDPNGYLYNELYDELYETGLDPLNKEPIGNGWGIEIENPGYLWGVDDGYGYYTGKTLGNNVVEVHPYIANYMFRGATTTAYLAVRDLAFTYMYTDDIRYGRLAAVMLDRLADILPDMSSGQYPFLVTDGGAGIGKIQGALNDCTVLRIYAQACDILYPLVDDPYVISYLSGKAEEYNLENPKLSGSDIWNNWSDGILREIYRSCLNTKLRGGFGHKQEALGTAAVVLDSMPETKEMLDWMYKYGFEDKANLICNGGNINAELVNTLDRDGFANHGSPNYNTTWIDFLMYVQSAIDNYDRYNENDLFDNPKFAKMFSVFTPFTLVSKYTAQIGDSGYTGSQTFECPTMENLVYAYKKLENPEIAKLIYLQSGKNYDKIHDDIMTKNPQTIADEIRAVIESEGEYLDSVMLTGAGFAVLRDGEFIKSVGVNSTYDSQRDFWMYFGLTEGHGHMGSLNLGMEAYGHNFAPDFGYPEGVNSSPERRWMDGTLAHNTVTVNAKNQLETAKATNPIHFDAGENVGVMDVDSSEVYSETKVYRRTLVSVKVSDEVSYGVDFFKVLGGNDHIYTFRAHSDEIFETEGLDITKQVDENGNYVGTYAGVDVEYAVDPGYVETGTPKYPIGFPFLKNVRRANDVEGSFAVDFKIKDFQKVLPYNMNLHLRLTALNDFETDEVAITSAYVPRRLAAAKYYDALEQVLIRRKGGETLNSLFTTVYEPYKDARYIESIEALEIKPVEGSIPAVDAAKAVKVTHTGGRIDYIAYSTDEERGYTIYDEELGRTLEFKGFVGVLSYMGDELIYSYIHDGEKFGAAKNDTVRLTGTVSDFEKELTLSNYITVTPDCDIDVEKLSDKYISVRNDGVRNGMYRILSASKLDGGDIKLDIGDVTLVRSYRDDEYPDNGFIYDIAEGQKFTIGLTAEETNAPEFAPMTDVTATAGSSVSVNVSATSPLGKEISYSALQLPRGATFDAENGTVTWKPGSSQTGENRVSILASDEDGREATLHFIITVYGSTTGAGSQTPSTPSTPSEPSTPSAPGTPGTSGGSAGGAGGGGGGGAAPAPSTPSDNKTDETPSVGDDDSSIGEGAEKVRFIDLGAHAWASDAINALADEGIIKGTSENTFSPAANITRADFALLLVRAFKLESENTENFADVASSDYFAAELAIARNTGVVNGIGDNKFAPRNTITRQDMMTIVYRALNSLPLEVAERERSVGAAMNDSPVDYQNRDVTEPQRDKVAPEATDEVSYP